MSVVKFKLFLEYAGGVCPQEENFARTQDLMARLRPLDPLFADISPIGIRGGFQRMAAEPLLRDIALDQWLTYYERDKNEMTIAGCRLSYWNRERKRDRRMSIACAYNDAEEGRTNYCMISPLPPGLIKLDLLPQIMLAFINAFDGFRAHYVWVDTDASLEDRHYQIWVRDDQARPVLGDSVRFPDNGHPPLPEPEPWHGGRLYTWPEHAPWDLLKQYDKYPQP
jgi:hypothetical protein